MDYRFDTSLVCDYKSTSQRIRIMSESWVSQNIFCPVCGNPRLNNMKNNMPVADFQCDSCGEIYELKSKQGKMGGKIADGAYDTMISRITSNTNPDLFLLQYTDNLEVVNLAVIPKFFFSPAIIEKRKPLSSNARRAGWIGCNIIYSSIPNQGRISIIQNQHICDKKKVVESYKSVTALKDYNVEKRGWLFDVLNCVNLINKNEFSLVDVYEYASILKASHTDNHNIEAKIRQQLQLLRDKGFIAFEERGKYRKLF